MRLGFTLIPAVLAAAATAQSPDSTRHLAGATISGVVRDSIARAPLGGAIVQLVAADAATGFGGVATSDSAGRFTFGGVPDGRYTIGFFHPILDSLGIEPVMREIYVVDQHPLRADLSVPSSARLRAAICGARAAADSIGILVGIVRRAADRAPVGGVTVIGDWLELSFTADGIATRRPRLVATSAPNGWFAMCNVPTAGTMTLSAGSGMDSTDVVEVRVPPDGFLRRELYLGRARSITVADTLHTDSLGAPPRIRVGSGRLSGTVVTITGGHPLPNAQISIGGGPRTRANERGEWTLADAPEGTRMLEVRAVGYYPERRVVDVVPDAVPVRVELFTLKAMLDTVKVTTNRLVRLGDRTGFEERRRSIAGTFLTDEDVTRRHPFTTSELLRTLPGIRIEYDSAGVNQQILMRSAFVTDAAAGVRDFGKAWCSPAFYVDGHYMNGLTAGDIDTWVRPPEIAGLEIYTESSVPAQFHWALSDCGAIVIWTKRPVHR